MEGWCSSMMIAPALLGPSGSRLAIATDGHGPLLCHPRHDKPVSSLFLHGPMDRHSEHHTYVLFCASRHS